MIAQLDKSKGPGIYIPPPLFYALTFVAAIFIQKRFPINSKFFHTKAGIITGILCIAIAIFFLFKSLRQFLLTRNTVVLIKPASSLQTTGIYSITRNPMYIGLAFLFLGITCLFGNWWNIILFPILILIIQEYIIKREEIYLALEFGQLYEEYRKRVRRWL